MKYTIYHSETALPNGKNGIGLEIQPPLGGTADAAAVMLAQKSEGFNTNSGHAADAATVTRNDAAGTVFIVAPNFYTAPTSAYLAKALGALVDPCGQHEIAFVPPISE